MTFSIIGPAPIRGKSLRAERSGRCVVRVGLQWRSRQFLLIELHTKARQRAVHEIVGGSVESPERGAQRQSSPHGRSRRVACIALRWLHHME